MFIKFDKSVTSLSGQDKAAKKKPGEKEEAAKADFARMISEKKNGLARAAVNGGNRDCAPATKASGKESKNNVAASPKNAPRQEVAKEPGADSNTSLKKQTGAPTSRAQVREGGKKESAVTPPAVGGREEKKKNTFTSQTIGEEGGGPERTFSTLKGDHGAFTSAALGEEGGQDRTFTTKTGGEEGGRVEDTFSARPTVNDYHNAPTGLDALTDSMMKQLLSDKGDDEEEEEDDFPVNPQKMTTMSLGEDGGKKNILG